jgi:hypothetical protein
MEFIESIVSMLAFAALGFSGTAAYLKINKIWKRKHNREVANSVSIAGNFVDLIPLTFFSAHYLLQLELHGFIDSLIWIVAGVVSIMIGSGLWVQENRQKTVWMRFKEALKLEKSEIGDLAKALFRPSGAAMILEIFAHFAYIDRELDDREKALIESFAKEWALRLDWGKYDSLDTLEGAASLIQAQLAVSRYLESSPPAEQVAQLFDVLRALVRADDQVASEEQLVLDETHGMLANYIDESEAKPSYAVVIAPQSGKQDKAIGALLPHVKKTELAGGSVYVAGSYHSRDYANMICEQYRQLGFFTVELVVR